MASCAGNTPASASCSVIASPPITLERRRPEAALAAAVAGCLHTRLASVNSMLPVDTTAHGELQRRLGRIPFAQHPNTKVTRTRTGLEGERERKRPSGAAAELFRLRRRRIEFCDATLVIVRAGGGASSSAGRSQVVSPAHRHAPNPRVSKAPPRSGPTEE